MTDAYATYQRLKFRRPAERILEIVLDSPGRLNATDAKMHEELAYVWRDIDADPDVSVAMIRGAGDAFSAGGDLELVEAMANDFATLSRVWREAREMVYNIINCSKPLVSAMHGPAVGAGLVCGILADVSIAAKTARIIDGHTRLGVAAGDHAAIIWPLLCGMAKAVVITAEHSTILVDLPKLRTGLVAWRTVGRRAQQGIMMQGVVATLELTDLTVHFRLAGRTVARLGAEAHPGWLSWLLGVRPLEIRPSGVVALVRALLPRPF